MRPIELREDAPAKPEHDAATELARRAGALLLDLRSRSPHSKRALSDEGDRCSHEFLMAQLATRFPQDPVRSEEGHDSPGAERLWVIDPLDGSREYGEGREDWAVHVALAEGGRPAVGLVQSGRARERTPDVRSSARWRTVGLSPAPGRW